MLDETRRRTAPPGRRRSSTRARDAGAYRFGVTGRSPGRVARAGRRDRERRPRAAGPDPVAYQGRVRSLYPIPEPAGRRSAPRPPAAGDRARRAASAAPVPVVPRGSALLGVAPPSPCPWPWSSPVDGPRAHGAPSVAATVCSDRRASPRRPSPTARPCTPSPSPSPVLQLRRAGAGDRSGHRSAYAERVGARCSGTAGGCGTTGWPWSAARRGRGRVRRGGGRDAGRSGRLDRERAAAAATGAGRRPARLHGLPGDRRRRRAGCARSRGVTSGSTVGRTRPAARSGQVIINLDRWRLSVPHFVRAGCRWRSYRSVRDQPRGGARAGPRARALPAGGAAGSGDDAADALPQGLCGEPVAIPGRRRYTGPPL